MRKETIHKLCCPFDKHDLELTVVTRSIDDTILEGILSCTSCDRVFPIISGIPIMNPDEYREFHLERPLLERLSGQHVSPAFRLEKVNSFREAE